MEILDYSWPGRLAAIVLLVHNLFAAYYSYALFHWYSSLCFKNMHSIEDTMISGLYDKARFHNLEAVTEDTPHVFYYTRPSYREGWCEMMGSNKVCRWITPWAYKNRQNHDLFSRDWCDVKEIRYMK